MAPGGVHVAAEEGRRLSAVRKPDPCTLVLFGVTGNLARRKLVPALYDLAAAGALPPGFRLVGFSRSAGGEGEPLRDELRAGVERHARRRPLDEAAWADLAGRIEAVGGSADDPDSYRRLARRLAEIESESGAGGAEGDTRGNRLFYLSLPPSVFPRALRLLGDEGLLSRASDAAERPWSRVIVEKPFGRDLASARELNRIVHDVLDESQVYRIDHYLGKETVQNILVLRFGNTIFEPLWNRNHVEHVQITMAESIGVEGRGAFYEETGVLRDVVQNHLLQVLALCAMEPPVSMEADEIRSVKAQVLRSVRAFGPREVDELVVAGQYEGYRSEKGVDPDSRVPTYVALVAHVDNWRWQGVPFYLRAGKGLARRVTEVSFHFRPIPFCLYGDEEICQLVPQNVLKLRIQPDEGVSLCVTSKIPGEDLAVGGVELDFTYAEAFERRPVEAYERLLLDAMRGDATLFARHDEVELSWRLCEPILERWAEAPREPERYARGSAGPEAADELLRRRGHPWVPLGTPPEGPPGVSPEAGERARSGGAA